ncbi:MAG: alpha amylase C-terminal domain-containing protein [Bacteroidales bacterium]|nr:alpha amylase C-terminal domain-containing protein [Bacteroidales bacterium]MCB8998621.1 alpha amylase C-terminal domain-containing protein [Bacteroidales bacterium]MCB9012511.1 alpha amylase C-terminal domain-containing protein [Bacteroidales bacterium]
MKIPGIVKLDSWLAPYTTTIQERMQKLNHKMEELGKGGKLSSFANGHLFFGLHRDSGNWIFREWAPNATDIYLVGSFNNWKESPEYKFSALKNGSWELILEKDKIRHKDLYKLSMHWKGGHGERIPAYATRTVQDDETKVFSAQVWAPEQEYQWKNSSPENHQAPLVYEAHVGMATEDFRVGQFKEFREKVLPRIIKAGYNTIQLMAIQEHPYYGSFGYHVSSLFAPSSRFGEPEELKALIDEAHGAGLKVIMDLVHSHAVRNENEGLGLYDGSPFQFFHTGARREHVAWDSLCYNYSKNEVIHFLLSNIQYWQKVYQFDGFRFDGVTSMLYYDHGLNRDFTNYNMYFDGGQDEDGICYLGLANALIHENNPSALSVAEEMSGYPGLAANLSDGGLGFDYRMAMGTPDYWIKVIKERADEDWNVGEMYYELTNKRIEEKTIGYAESHDQALVGDQTIIFRLIGKEMYYSMDKLTENLIVDRGIALHKMIRLLTLATAGNGYLNFMGNEFGHPEWIDFPRLGNDWSYHYARRQWSLADNHLLRYHQLGEFDNAMIHLVSENKFFKGAYPGLFHENTSGQVLGFERGDFFFVFNFNPSSSFTDYGLNAPPSKYSVVLDTDQPEFGGQGRIDHNFTYRTLPVKNSSSHYLKLYLPARTGLVLKKEKIKGVFDTP